MDNAHTVSGLERKTDLAHQFSRILRWQLAPVLKLASQVFAIDEFHGDEFHRTGFTKVV